MIPGVNLLGMALRLITPQTISYFACTGRATNAVGVDAPTFAAPVTLANVSVQPVPLEKYETLQLDFGRAYVTLYTQRGTVALQRGDNGGDEFEYDGRRWHITSNTRWAPLDGWDGAIAVAITNA